MKRLSLISIFLLSACQATQTPALADPAVNRGAKLYQEYCVACHGENLTGGQAPSLADDNWEYGSTDADILKVINEGIEEVGMPEFASLSEEEKQDLITYIRSGGDLKTTTPIDDVSSVEDHVQIDDWVTGLNQPWGIHFIGPDTALATEKSGKLWQVSSKSRMEVIGIPASVDQGQGGLMDVATDPDYAENGWIYLSFTHADETKPDNRMTKIVRGKITKQETRLTWANEETLF